MFSKEKAIKKLQEQIGYIDLLKTSKRDAPAFKKWIRDTQVAIQYIFGQESRHLSDFKSIRYSLMAFHSGTPDHKFQEAYISGLAHAKAILESMVEEVSEYWQDTIDESGADSPISTSTPLSNKQVFIIHGHDSGVKETVARFLAKIGLEPIILHEQVSQGKTIIEKFEENADVSYAIALLTPDDVGSSVADSENTRLRARQNVIFEFGYFIGKLGRKNVVGLIKGNIETPSDYSGILYIPIDDNSAWKFLLVKELKAVGFDIDANKAI